jgi:hypothetical protein
MPLRAKGEILKNQVAWDGYVELCEIKLRLWREWAESLLGKQEK